MTILPAFDNEKIDEEIASFAELHSPERYEQVYKAASRLCRYLDPLDAKDMAEDFLEDGLCEELLSLPADLIKRVKSVRETVVDSRTVMIIVSLSSEYEPFTFSSINKTPFKEFQNNLHRASRGMVEEDDLDLVQALYRHVKKYGMPKDSIGGYMYETYFAFVVLAMKNVHGRDRVISTLDRVTAQESVTSLEFIRLLELDSDFDEMPISWMLNI